MTDTPSPLERLMAETIPTRPPPPPKPQPPARPIRSWTPEEQAQHWADLGAAIADWHWEDDPRHLRLVAGETESGAA